jgi:L-lactate dehydrogenase complex protein LldF
VDVHSKNFIPLVNVALEDTRLKNSMNMLGKSLASKRASAIAGLPEFDELRGEARDIKNHTLAHLDIYLEKFEEQVLSKGGHVHWASSDIEARQIVLDICLENNAKRITKSKSMVTEEIDLVPFLEENGMEAIETDLGEYIIQLRGERPSHIIAPAVHLSKDQVADTFFDHHSKLGFNEKLNERADLVGEARQVLRERFLKADVGISGANFLVAETGTVVLVTNEGNAELTTSIPDTHIVVTGIEKLIPTLEDASTFIRVLARSAVGAEISAYTSFITGPRRENDMDGPENFHVVLVDNGRSNMLGTEMQDMLRCIRCSACLNHCPVYLSVGGHAYGSVYSGPMGAVLTPQFSSIAEARQLPNASTFCGRCEEVCPVHIPLPKLMRHWRDRESKEKLNPFAMRFGLRVWAYLNRHEQLYRLICSMGIKTLRLLADKDSGQIHKLPSFFGNWTIERDFRQPPRSTFKSQWKEKRKKGKRKKEETIGG